MVNAWKVTAIIFIILFVLETIAFSTLYIMGTTLLKKDYLCSVDVCSVNEAYIFDYETHKCSCINSGEIVYEEYI